MQTVQRVDAHERYRADGYYIHSEPVLPPDLIERAREGMDAVRDGVYDTGTPPRPSPWTPGDDPAKLVKIEMPQLASRAIFEALTHPALGERAALVTGARAVQIWWVQELIKPSLNPGAPSAPTNVGWHQDRQYWSAWDEDSELFTAWLALSDVTADAGPMRFVPASHTWGLLEQGDFFAQELEAQRAAVRLPEGAEWQEVPAILPPGGVSFHHNLTLHGSGPNTSGRLRRSFAVHMRTENSCPIGGRREGLAEFIDNLDYCPVIYGERDMFRG